MKEDSVAMRAQPNLLLIMSDEHAPQFSGAYGHPLVQTPWLDRLASEGVLFEHAYCNSPLCGPSRMSFMTGRHVHQIGAWDNATSLPSDVPTWAHMLRAAGYDVVPDGCWMPWTTRAWRTIRSSFTSATMARWRANMACGASPASTSIRRGSRS